MKWNERQDWPDRFLQTSEQLEVPDIPPYRFDIHGEKIEGQVFLMSGIFPSQVFETKQEALQHAEALGVEGFDTSNMEIEQVDQWIISLWISPDPEVAEPDVPSGIPIWDTVVEDGRIGRAIELAQEIAATARVGFGFELPPILKKTASGSTNHTPGRTEPSSRFWD